MSPKGTATGIWTGGAFSAASGTGTVTVSFSGYESGTGTLYGPDGTTAISGDTVLSEAPAGAYWMEWDDVTDYLTPAVAYGNLSDDGTLTLAGTYVELPGVTPDSVLSLPILNGQNIFAASATWQAMTGAANATEAKDFIYTPYAPGDTSNPFMVLSDNVSEAFTSIGGGAANIFRANGAFYVLIQTDVESGDTPMEAYWRVNNQVGKIIEEVEELAGTPGYLDVRNITKVEGPIRSDEDEETQNGSAYWQTKLLIQWGGTGR